MSNLKTKTKITKAEARVAIAKDAIAQIKDFQFTAEDVLARIESLIATEPLPA